jgi:Ni/Fe-hydrogenase subunit HybB-like protein
MIQLQHRRPLFLVAAIAVGVALLLLLVPHGHQHGQDQWLAILPLLFVGIISPLSLLSTLTPLYLAPASDAPALPASFQRPPPIALE